MVFLEDDWMALVFWYKAKLLFVNNAKKRRTGIVSEKGLSEETDSSFFSPRKTGDEYFHIKETSLLEKGKEPVFMNRC